MNSLRSFLAALSATIFFVFAVLVALGLPQRGLVGCYSQGVTYTSSGWIAAQCRTTTGTQLQKVMGWESYGRSLGAGSGFHTLFFDVGIGVLAWFVALGLLAAAVAIPFKTRPVAPVPPT